MIAERESFGWEVPIERLGSSHVPPILKIILNMLQFSGLEGHKFIVTRRKNKFTTA